MKGVLPLILFSDLSTHVSSFSPDLIHANDQYFAMIMIFQLESCS
jgi:hypothetical protein